MRGIAAVGACLLMAACGQVDHKTAPTTSTPAPISGDSTFRVHDDWAGQWQAGPVSEVCVWNVYLKDGDSDALTTLDSGSIKPGQTATATIPAPAGHRLLFQTSGCGTWTHVGG